MSSFPGICRFAKNTFGVWQSIDVLLGGAFTACEPWGKAYVGPKICNPARPLQESAGPSGPGIPKESPKSLPGGSKKCPKLSRNSRRSLKTVYFETSETVSRLSRTLFGPRGRKAPGDSLETLSGFRARRAQQTLVRGGRGFNQRYRATLRYYLCDTPYCTMPSQWAKHSPKKCNSLPLGTFAHLNKQNCAIPSSAPYHAIRVRYPKN